MIILAVDPGRDKCGVAVVSDRMEIHHKKIVNSRDICAYLNKLVHKYDIDKVIIGNGTASQAVKGELCRQVGTGLPVVTVDERDSTREAEERYLQDNPPRGIKKLLSKFVRWRVEKPLDDYTAVILAERFFAGQGK